MNADSFLADVEDIRPFPSLGDAGSLEPLRLAIGHGTRGLEIAVARAARKPTQEASIVAICAMCGKLAHFEYLAYLGLPTKLRGRLYRTLSVGATAWPQNIPAFWWGTNAQQFC